MASAANPLFNVVPLKKDSTDSRAYTAPEVRVSDTLPERAPEFYPATVTEQRVFKWLQVHGLIKGVHKQCDALLMQKLCKAVADAMALEQKLATMDAVYEIEDNLGNTHYRLRPEVGRLERLNREIMSLVKLLDLHPGARRKLVQVNRKVTADINRWGT